MFAPTDPAGHRGYWLWLILTAFVGLALAAGLPGRPSSATSSAPDRLAPSLLTETPTAAPAPSATITPTSIPGANFVGAPLAGPAPLAVEFTHLDGSVLTYCGWSFGDGATQVVTPTPGAYLHTCPNVTHTYTAPGSYAVSLTVQKATGAHNSFTRPGYIQVSGSAQPTLTATATLCPRSTPEPLWVEPVISPTGLLAQVVTVRIGNGEAVTVTTTSGVFTATGSFNAYGSPALVHLTLLPDTVHALTVQGRVRQIVTGDGCEYGGYTLQTDRDRTGRLLVIAQILPRQRIYLPLLLR